MKTRLLLMIGLCLAMSTMTAQAGITDVFIFPEEPIVINPITIFVSGVESGGGVTIDNSDFQIDGTSLTLDIYIDIGLLTVVTPWSHSEDIGLLGAGIYELTANTFFEQVPFFNDSYYTTFEVTPEPSTLILFALGGLMVRKRK